MKLMKNIFYAFLIVLFLTNACTNEQVLVKELKCEYLTDPLGVDLLNPRLSWKIESATNGQKQTAYQIIVSTNKDSIEADTGNLWDTEMVKLNQSTHIIYGGKELHSGEKVYWKVRVWDMDNKPSAWSEISTWEMGLDSFEWDAKWIGFIEYKKLKLEERNPAIYFQKTSQLPDQVKKARAYISGLGYYELHINGKKVGDHVLSPNHTNYDRRQSQENMEESSVRDMASRVLYETWDISSYLMEGENLFDVSLGNGWYFQNKREEDPPYSYDTPRFIAQFEIEFEDGTTQQILSDNSWDASFGPIVHNGLYSGEIYDARLEEKKWKKAIIVRPPEGKLKAQMSPPDRIIRTIKPISMTLSGENAYTFDLGEMISGWARLKINGPEGTSIRMKFHEEDGPSYGQTDTYILNGNGSETWEPHFVWHAFRYIEVFSSIPLNLDNITGVVVNTDVKSAGTFESSNELFNKIVENYKRTQLGNLHGGISSDCPHRERRGYTGDGQIATQAAILNFDMAAFYTKWINDFQDSQNPTTGYVPNTVPYQGGGGGTPWGSAYVIMPWYVYLYYGDIDILAQHYSGMKHWMEYLEEKCNGTGIIDEQNLGEWVPPAPTEIPASFVSTAYYYFNLNLMAKIAAILKNLEDAAYFEHLAQLTKDAFNEEYYNESEKSYSIGRQGANVFALGFDLVPENKISEVFKSLVQNIKINTDEHFDTGMMGTPLVLDVLSCYGRIDLAYSMMNQHDYPSFGYAIDQGATTIWETWLGDASHSHPMFGSVCQWFYQALAGINADPKYPGFKHIIIKPQAIGNLDFVKTTHSSVHGEIESAWEWNEDDLIINISIPTNTTARVILPTNDPDDVRINNRNVERCENVSFIEFSENTVKYEIESGKYNFTIKNVRNLIPTSRLSAPEITPVDSLLFTPDTAKVKITSSEENTIIKYTLNGEEPNEQSQVYSQTLNINSNSIVKAKVFKKGFKPSSIRSSTLTFIDQEKNGVNYEYFSGTWNDLPNFSSLKPIRSGKIYEISLDQIPSKEDRFGLVLSSNIEISKPGLYTFYITSNDGSKLYVDDKLIIENGGLHGAIEKQANMQLSKGKHHVKIDYFQAGGGLFLEALISGPEVDKICIPASMLFRY